MALTAQLDEMYSGDRRTLIFTVRDDAGAIVPIQTATFKWGLYRSVLAATPEVEKVSGESPSEIDPEPAGIVKVHLYPPDTAGISGDYYHELEMTDAVGNPTTVAFGTLTINQDRVNA